MDEIKRILLAEDDPHDLELTLAALEEHDLIRELAVVRDGAEVLDYLRCAGTYRQRQRGNPGVVLLDLHMPKLDGLQVLRAIRSDPAFQLIPVVMLTSSRAESDLVESYHLGVNGYVIKPVNYTEFVAVVGKVGLFWGLANQPPPGSTGRDPSQSGV